MVAWNQRILEHSSTRMMAESVIVRDLCGSVKCKEEPQFSLTRTLWDDPQTNVKSLEALRALCGNPWRRLLKFVIFYCRRQFQTILKRMQNRWRRYLLCVATENCWYGVKGGLSSGKWTLIIWPFQTFTLSWIDICTQTAFPITSSALTNQTHPNTRKVIYTAFLRRAINVSLGPSISLPSNASRALRSFIESSSSPLHVS